MKNQYTLRIKLVIERHRLETMTEKYGLLHPEVLKQSKKLDEIIVRIQKEFAL
ncbi:MAG: aspartyl-phosphate phosphatase Spo0E family protein [Bacillota bacterium]